MDKIVDVYDMQYDYDDIKIAATITDYIRNVRNEDYMDFEDLAEMTLTIHNAYKVADDISKEEQGYIQKYVYRFLDEYFEKEGAKQC